jgi:hypothetical protein
LASIRNGPISQSPGIARTRKKTRISPAANRRNPKRRRRLRSGFSPDLGAPLIGAAGTTAAGAGLIGTAATTDSCMALIGAAASTGCGAAMIGSTCWTGSAVTAGVVETVSDTAGFVSAGRDLIGAPNWITAAPPVSSCNLALAGLIGAVTVGGAGTAS